MSEKNRLVSETSPYLLQHADNPVDWHPWGPEALALARERNLPILLSIGYSACHWCHVMAHESFENDETAALMNQGFINIKVDREERPDIDRIYQTAHQLLTHRPGGWPLTMFLDPVDQRPFFGGTYFPDESRHGLPAFRDLLTRAAVFFRDQRDDVRAQGEQLAGILATLEPPPGSAALDDAPLQAARMKLASSFDRQYGGLGSAPKFPHPSSIDRLLRHWRASAHDEEPDTDALFMVTLTLQRMAEGGLFDQLGGGFSRYSVDAAWQIPHFEKMLYDNGPLLALYAEAGVATGDEFFHRIANESADWLLSDMQAPNGGFYATRDADSEGEEGRFYVWTREEIEELLNAEHFAVVERHFGLDLAPNFEGRWHLTVQMPVAEVAEALDRDPGDIRELIDEARQMLLAARSSRVPPARDEKQLTAWNGLAIRGLAIAGTALERDDLIDAAARAADFLQQELMQEGRLLASYKDGLAKFPGYLDDHAFLLDGLLELLQARWNTAHLAFAVSLAELLVNHFFDHESGGFYFTADDHEQLMHRPKPLADDATPSGNGVAAIALQRLGFLLGESRYLEATEKTLQSAWQAIEEYPHGHVTLITALEEYLRHPEIIVIRGERADSDRWRRSVNAIYAPRRLVFGIPADAVDLPGALAERKPVATGTIAYRCEGSHCSLPIKSLEKLAATLSGN